MHFTTLVTIGLAQLAILTATSPVRLAHAVDILSYLPDRVVWHATNAISASNIPAALPAIGGNVTACTAVYYDNVSTERTAIVRDDCLDLANQVKAAPGFWELYRWARDDTGRFEPLVSNGTCEFAVRRHDTPVGFKSNSSDVVM